jgi:uncharacterized OB-fold protein
MAPGETASSVDLTGVAVPVREGLFTLDAPHRLLGSRCEMCGRHHFPCHDTCPYCGADDVAPVELSGTGRLWSWTAVTSAPPGYRGEVPYGFGVVELPEGIRVVARLTEPDPARLSAGQPMELVVVSVPVDDERQQVLTYAFAPGHDQ